MQYRVFEDFDLSPDLDVLVVGPNVMAIHGLNRTHDDADMLIRAARSGVAAEDETTLVPGYFTTRTPGAANRVVVTNDDLGAGRLTARPVAGRPSATRRATSRST